MVISAPFFDFKAILKGSLKKINFVIFLMELIVKKN
jgi:hypothetical protein